MPESILNQNFRCEIDIQSVVIKGCFNFFFEVLLKAAQICGRITLVGGGMGLERDYDKERHWVILRLFRGAPSLPRFSSMVSIENFLMHI